MKSYRLTRTQTVFDIALEDDSVGLSEPESLVHADQGVALRGEPREDGRVNRATLIVDDREGWARILGKKKYKILIFLYQVCFNQN